MTVAQQRSPVTPVGPQNARGSGRSCGSNRHRRIILDHVDVGVSSLRRTSTTRRWPPATVVAIDGPTTGEADTRYVAVLGDLFAPLDELDPATRVALAELVAVRGHAVATTPRELGDRPVPADRDARAGLVTTIATGLTNEVARALTEHRVDAIVPALRWPAATEVMAAIPALQRRLGDGGDLRTRTVGDVAGSSGRNVKSVVALLTALVTAGHDVIAVAAPCVDPTLDLATVLAADGGAIRRAIGDLASNGRPDVRAAADRLLAVDRVDPRLRPLEDALASAGDVRDRAVFEHAVLGLGPPVTKHDLGDRLGVGYERVRQLLHRATARVDAALDELPTELVDLAAELAHTVGAAAPVTALDHALTAAGLPALPDTRSRLLLRLAGPYRAVDGHPGWVATDPAELVAETRRLLHDDGGVNLLTEVTRALLALGVADAHVPAWLDRQPVGLLEGLVVLRTGSPATIAERVLHATGRPMSIGQVAGWLPDGADARWWVDRRFRLAADGALVLAEWVADTDAGATFGPTLRIVVDHDVLAGGHGPLAPGVVTALGLRPGAHRTLTTRYGPVAVIHDGDTPARGSLRPIALAVGAALGDELAISIYPDGRGADVTIVRPPTTDRQGDHG